MSDNLLLQHRGEIDAIDEQLIQLLNKRAELARAIGHLKSGIMYRPEREAQVIQQIKTLNHGPLSNDAVTAIFKEVMSACLALEKPLAIAYLGPAGTFSEAASMKHFGRAAHLSACNSLAEVFRDVEADSSDYAVVPVENSTEGVVNITLDLLLQTSLSICSEVQLPIEQCLLRKVPGLKGITKIYSHAQSLAQCRQWLQQNLPDVDQIQVVSNAKACQMAAEDPNTAAIAGITAAKLYDLQIINQYVQDNPNNTTRFLVLGKHTTVPSGQDKTSIIVAVENHPGAIHNLLAPLATHQVNITRLDSRPSRNRLWDYLFFIDLQGHQQEKPVAAVLNEIKQQAAYMKILGSYPQTDL